MKSKRVILAAGLLALAVSVSTIVFGASGEEETKKVASDGASIQTEDPQMPTRVIEEGTKILLHFGDTVIPGILNDCDTAQALIEKLPYTVHMNSYSHDFCGVMPDELPYNEEEVHYGWLNGDIDYAIDAPDGAVDRAGNRRGSVPDPDGVHISCQLRSGSRGGRRPGYRWISSGACFPRGKYGAV